MAYDPAIAFPSLYPDQSGLIRGLKRDQPAGPQEIKKFTIPKDADIWQEVLRGQKATITVAIRGHLAFRWPDNYADHDPVVATITVGEKTYPTVIEGICTYDDRKRTRLSYWYSVEGVPNGSGREWERMGFLEAVCNLARHCRAGENDPYFVEVRE